MGQKLKLQLEIPGRLVPAICGRLNHAQRVELDAINSRTA